MAIEFTISGMNYRDVLPQEVALALRAFQSTVITPNLIINPTVNPEQPAQPEPVSFDELLIKTAENIWHVVENTTLASGASGTVKKALRKIVIGENGHATCLLTDDVVKIQKLGAELYLSRPL